MKQGSRTLMPPIVGRNGSARHWLFKWPLQPSDQINMETCRLHRGLATPITACLLVLLVGGAAVWLRAASMQRDVSALIGATRADAEELLGRLDFTAGDYAISHRTSVRRGGIKMKHSELQFHHLKSRHGLDAAHADRVLVWTDDERIRAYAERCTAGDLASVGIDTGIAVDQPGRVLLARLGHDGRVKSMHEMRPSFVINLMD